MNLPLSQQKILAHLKIHGPQSVRILASRLGMTTMGVRQHLAGLQDSHLVKSTAEARQRRGRPLHLWELTGTGHAGFPDSHRDVSVELIEAIEAELGNDTLNALLERRGATIRERYQGAMAGIDNLQSRLRALAGLRSDDGYMAEVRLLPDGNWLLIENHCPICAAAERCDGFCATELSLFRQVLGERVTVERVDHLLEGDRRCAYRVSQAA